MTRIGSLMALGFLLALPLSASAGAPVDPKDERVAAVETNEAPARVSAKTETPDKQPEKHKVRGATHGDPGVRFNNPYAFPIQSLPLGLPNITSFSF